MKTFTDWFCLWLTVQLVVIGGMVATFTYKQANGTFDCTSKMDGWVGAYTMTGAIFPLLAFVAHDHSYCEGKKGLPK